MERYFKITVSVLASLLILVGSAARFHHHAPGDNKPCFGLELSCCCHDHHDADNSDDHHGSQGHGSDSEENCPLHLDYFNITEQQDHVDASHHCCHAHCDMCTPIVYVVERSESSIPCRFCSQLIISDLYDGVTPTRRGPPMMS